MSTTKTPTLVCQQHTPPPDNFGHILPCTHLTSVLETKAHDTVMATYRQAVAILIAINPLLLRHVVYTLKKDGLPVQPARLAEYKSQVLRCGDCDASNFYLVFICLQCPHVGCYHKHAQTHAKEQNHMFAIDSHNGLLFCFLCGDYINHSALNRIRLAAVASMAPSAKARQDSHLDNLDNMDELDPSNLASYYSMPSSHAVHGLKGIVNLGATCFMSCVLQTMLHNPLVRYQFFNNDLHFFNCDSHAAEIDGLSACITCLVDAVFKECFTSLSHDGFGITNLLITAWFRNQLLAGFQEQDAHEFWQFLLNEFHSDYERVALRAGIPPEPCKCVAHATFLGQLESSVVCGNCKAVTRTVDPLVDLSLEVNHLDLYECLDQFTHSEALDVKYRCQACLTETKAHRSLRIKKIPPVLSIQLKRFKHNFANETSKIETKVHAPLFLNLTRYASDYAGLDQIDSNKVYELFAVVSHIGSVNTGHYVALVKNNTGQWFKFDDSVITHISHEEVQATNAYLLFYIAHNI